MAKKRTPQERSADPAAQEMIIRAEELGIRTAFDRADEMSPCNIGGSGMCCKLCGMGPCRLTKDGQTGVCGATIDTIQARNLVRAIAAGGAAHSDHGRDMAFTLKAAANGKAEGYYIRDVAKLRTVASHYDIEIEGRAPEEIANDLADLYIAQFGQQTGEVVPVRRAPQKRQKIWREQNVVPRGVDREVVEAYRHREHPELRTDLRQHRKEQIGTRYQERADEQAPRDSDPDHQPRAGRDAGQGDQSAV